MRIRMNAALALVFYVVGCGESPIGSSAATDVIKGPAVPHPSVGDNKKVPTFALEAPPGAPYPDAGGTGWLWPTKVESVEVWQQVQLQLHGLPCRALWPLGGSIEQRSREFYVLYVSTASGRIRVHSFNMDCWGENTRIAPHLPALPAGEVTIEIFLETDDGEDAYSLPVLRGSVTNSD